MSFSLTEGPLGFPMPASAAWLVPAILSCLTAAAAFAVILSVFHQPEMLRRTAEAEAARRGLSKAALIRASLAHELAVDERPATDPWEAITGWLDDGPVDDLDAVIYERGR